jgi:tRNA U34 5-methylaminomethyl-2-thiouridine-forming methyltransferase MnmC
LTELVKTADGSHTLFVPELNEHYHSINGAIQESMLVFIENGFMFCKADPVHILEIGFGTGLNVLLTAIESNSGNRKVFYNTLEKHPLPADIINRLNYSTFCGKTGKEIFKRVHEASWGLETEICKDFILKKTLSDLISDTIAGKFDLIYFDAFGPDKQPEIWTNEIFSKIASATAHGGTFVTYSAKGDVKRKLLANGFNVTLLPGPPGKRHMIRAVKL